MSRHNPHPRQLDELRRMYGSGTVIEQEVHPFDDAHQIARRFREGDYGVMVVVAPLSVISVLCTEGVPMLWSVATEENDPAKVEFRGARGQGFRFVRFRRIKRVAVEYEDD